MKLKLEISLELFETDFLKSDILKELGIHGDDLFRGIKEEYRNEIKNFGDVFTGKYDYVCEVREGIAYLTTMVINN